MIRFLASLLVAASAMAQVTGELKQWHKVTLTINGPQANETDTAPNPFADFDMTVRFSHESGEPVHAVPGYFAADGNAAMTSATSGNKWRAHLSPDKPGRWTYKVSFRAMNNPVRGPDGLTGTFDVGPSDKRGRDFRSHGRLQHVGKHHLRFAGSGEYFLKAGADAPETLLAYSDFDGTEARKKNVPLKTWSPHLADWKEGDPTWKDGKGKGLIGALNYLASAGCNAFSFLPYNAGGDGDNVWPYVSRDDKFHFDCSKLDQWGIVFDHATKLGLFLHFKLQETEMDDDRPSHNPNDPPKSVPTSLDGGALGPERKLYLRELIARFGHALALNWNLGEENTQTPDEQKAMAQYIRDLDPYDHLIVVHTFPDWQDRVYNPLLGKDSPLTGASLQNGWNQAHQKTLLWVGASARAGKPWVVANDEQGSADLGVPPDPGYKNGEGKAGEGDKAYDLHDIRKQTLWGTIMAGGAGVEYYFGYKLLENDLLCEDWRSRDQSWKYAGLALKFLNESEIPFWSMTNANALIGNPKNDNTKYCLAAADDTYLIYLPNGGSTDLDLSEAKGEFRLGWFNPRTGEASEAKGTRLSGGAKTQVGPPPSDQNEDWLALIRR